MCVWVEVLNLKQISRSRLCCWEHRFRFPSLLCCCIVAVDRERRGSARTRLLAQRVPQECTVVNGAIRQRRCVGLPVLPVIEGGRGAPYHRSRGGGGGVQGSIPLHILSLSRSLAPRMLLIYPLIIYTCYYVYRYRYFIMKPRFNYCVGTEQGPVGMELSCQPARPGPREPSQYELYECLRAQCITLRRRDALCV